MLLQQVIFDLFTFKDVAMILYYKPNRIREYSNFPICPSPDINIEVNKKWGMPMN